MAGKATYQDLEQRVRELEGSLIEIKDEEIILKRKTSQQRLLLDTIDIQVWYLNDPETYGSVNRAHVEFLGRRFQDVAHKKMKEFLPRETAELFGEGNLDVFNSRQTVRKEAWIPNSRGENRLISMTKSPSLDSNGNVEFVVCTGMDVTERNHTEEALRESDKKFQVLMENTSVGIYLIQDEKFIYVNPAFETITGATLSDLADIPFWRYVHPDFRELVKGRGSRCLKGETIPDRYEFKLVAKGGQERWVEISATVLNLWHKPTMMGSMFDITERKLAEEASRLSEEKFRKIFMMTPDCIAITRMQDGMLLDANEGHDNIVGWRRDEVIRQRTSLKNSFWNNPADRDVLVEELRSGHDVLHREFKFNRRDGAVRDGIYSARPIQISGEECLIFVLQDITDRRRMEEEHRKLEQQLIRSQKMESIGTLAGGIAHDFNNLLMGIQGHASMMRLDLDPSHPHYVRLKYIEEQVQSGADLTRQLLGFARGGRYTISTADINHIVDKTAGMFGRTKKEITIHKHLLNGLWAVEADHTQMEQVFMNLYVNAWHAMPGGGELFLKTDNLHVHDYEWLLPIDPGKYVKITVADTGTGMDAKTRERIFDPFFTTKEMGRGTGLGLATVYGIIKGHGGLIDVTSVQGQGTSFDIYLPATEKAVVREATVSAKFSRGNETILLVDDEQIVLDVAKEMLEILGYRVYCAHSGQEAVSAYDEKKHEIDLIILDMIMPVMSGNETFDYLKKINPHVKILLSSGYSAQGKAREILDRGCNGFIQKPFRLERLAQEVRSVLD